MLCLGKHKADSLHDKLGSQLLNFSFPTLVTLGGGGILYRWKVSIPHFLAGY